MAGLVMKNKSNGKVMMTIGDNYYTYTGRNVYIAPEFVKNEAVKELLAFLDIKYLKSDNLKYP